jgi:type IV secretory pathway TrbL component
LRFFEISAFLIILAGARRAQKRQRDEHTDSREIHALRGSKREKGVLGGSRSTRRAG